MVLRKQKNQSGGSAGGGGYRYQAQAYATAAARILACKPFGWANTGCNQIPIAVHNETGAAGDDLLIELESGKRIEVQAKTKFTSRAAQWKVLITLAGAIDKDPNTYGVILVSSKESQVIRVELRNAIRRAALNDDHNSQRDKQTQELLVRLSEAGFNTSAICGRLSIVVRDFDDGSEEEEHTVEVLQGELSDRGMAKAVHEILISDGMRLIQYRGKRDAISIADMLRQSGVSLIRHHNPLLADVEQIREVTRRDAKERRIQRMAKPLGMSEVGQAEDLLAAGKHAVITGEAGIGKSGIAYALCSPRANADMLVLYCDARRYRTIRSQNELAEQIGLRSGYMKSVRGIASMRPLRLIIDHLDGIVTEDAGAILIQAAIDSAACANVQVAVLSRQQDEYEKALLRELTNAHFDVVECTGISESVARTTLQALGLPDPTAELVTLSRNLLNLDIVATLLDNRPEINFSSILQEVDLWLKFVEVFIESENRLTIPPDYGNRLMKEATSLARDVLAGENNDFISDPARSQELHRLESWGIIVKQDAGWEYGFRHDKFIEFLYVRDVVNRHLTPDQILEELHAYWVHSIIVWTYDVYRRINPSRAAAFLRAFLMADERGGISFLAKADVLDKFVHADNPGSDAETADIIIEALTSDSDMCRHFLRKQPNSAWVPILWMHGFFDKPPSPVQAKDSAQFPYRSAQAYLMSVAKDVPEYVLRHLATLTKYPEYIRDAMAGFDKNPIDLIEKAVPILNEWLTDYATADQLKDNIWEILYQIVKERRPSTLSLFTSMLRPFTNRGTRKIHGHTSFCEAISVLSFSSLTRPETIDAVRGLAVMNPTSLLESLNTNLRLALRLEHDARGMEKDIGTWRRAIEPSPQNDHHYFKDFLLDIVRDAAEANVQQNGGDRRIVIEQYLCDTDPLFRRIGLHLLRPFATELKDMCARELRDAENYDSAPIHHEFFLLLKEGYTDLSETERSDVVDIILRGPPAEHLQNNAEYWAEERGLGRTEYIDMSCKHWIQKRLWMIREYAPDRAKVELNRLIAELGEPLHPEFSSWRAQSMLLEQESPVSSIDLQLYTPDKLLSYVRNWQPSQVQWPELEHDLYRAFGVTLARAVIPNIAKFNSIVVALISSHPEYGNSMILELLESEKRQPFTGDDLGRFVGWCEDLVGDKEPRTAVDGIYHADWRTVRRRMLDLLRLVLHSAEWHDRLDLHPRVRYLLLLFLKDADPDGAADQPPEGWLGHNDPSTVALNHIRPEALVLLIVYAVLNAEGAINASGEDPPPHEKLELSVKEALTRSLDDRSLAVHSVYGRYLTCLHWLDRDWVALCLNAIFPNCQSQEPTSRFVSAWDSYVIFNSYIEYELLDLLHKNYVQAIDNMKCGYVTKSKRDPVFHLAEHLVQNYFEREYGCSDLPSSLLTRFFEVATVAHRAHAALAVRNLCKVYYIGDRVSQRWWFAACALWQDRVRVASLRNCPSEFHEEMARFIELLDFVPADQSVDSMWELLRGSLVNMTPKFYGYAAQTSVERFLAIHVHAEPLRTIETLTLLCANVATSRLFAVDVERMHEILAVAASSPDTCLQTLDLIAQLARQGDHNYRDIYDRSRLS